MVYLIIFVILVAVYPFETVGQKQAWSNVVASTCKFTVNHDLDIRFEQNPLLFIDRLTEPDVNSCRKQCCDHKTCNSYVWDAYDRVNGNCKLLKCSDEGTDCRNALTRRTSVGEDRSQHEVGFITGVTDNTTPNPLDAVLGPQPTPKTTTLKTNPPHMYPSSQVKQDNLVTDTPFSRKPLASTTTTTKSVPLIKDMAERPSTTTTTSSTTFMRSAMSTIKPATSTKTSTVVTPVPTIMEFLQTNQSTTDLPSTTPKKTHIHTKTPKNVTKSSSKGVIEAGSGISHSDNISLTGAVFFGLAFSFVTIYLVGKRWIEGLRESKGRRGYTRISYLLNGV